MSKISQLARIYCRGVVEELPQTICCAAIDPASVRMLASYPHRLPQSLGHGIAEQLAALLPTTGESFLRSTHSYFVKRVEAGRLVLIVVMPPNGEPLARWRALRQAAENIGREWRERALFDDCGQTARSLLDPRERPLRDERVDSGELLMSSPA